MQIIFEKSDGTAEKTIDISLDSKLGESREVAQMLLGLPENPPCKLVLERTGKELKDNLTFRQSGIQQNDKLILFPLNTFSTNRESKVEDNAFKNTTIKEPKVSSNIKKIPTVLITSGIVLILGFSGLVYRQIQQQTIIAEKLEQEKIQRQDAEQKQEETQRQLDLQQSISEEKLEQERIQRQNAEKKREEAKRQLDIEKALYEEKLAQERIQKRKDIQIIPEQISSASQSASQAVVFSPPSNIRTTPNSKSDNILCSVRSRSTINIYEPKGNWFKTDVCGQQGYIHQSQIKIHLNSTSSSLDNIDTSASGVAIVFDPPSNVRSTPNGKIICSVRSKRHINIYNSVGEWYRTDFCGSLGYIHESQVDF